MSSSESSSIISIKAVFQNDVRRFQLDTKSSTPAESLREQLAAAYNLPASLKFVLRYTDDEGELITVSTADEIAEAWRIAQLDGRKVLKLFVSEQNDNGDVASVIDDAATTATNNTNNDHNNNNNSLSSPDSDFVQVDTADFADAKTPELPSTPKAAAGAAAAVEEPALFAVPDDEPEAPAAAPAAAAAGPAASDAAPAEAEAQPQADNNIDNELYLAMKLSLEEAQAAAAAAASAQPAVHVHVHASPLTLDDSQLVVIPDVPKPDALDVKVLEPEVTHPVDAAAAAPAAPASHEEEDTLHLLSADEVLALATDFLQNDWAHEEVAKACELAATCVDSGSVMDAVQKVLAERERIADSPLAVQLCPHLPSICARAAALPLSKEQVKSVLQLLPNLLKACQQPYILTLVAAVVRGDVSPLVEYIQHDALLVSIPPKDAADDKKQDHNDNEEEEEEADADAEQAHELPQPQKDARGQWVHEYVTCDVCRTNPIVGIRYKCNVCPDYDMCEACEAKGTHPRNHILLKIRQPVLYRQARNGAWRRVQPSASQRRHAAPAFEVLPDDAVLEGEPSQTVTKIFTIKNVGGARFPVGMRLAYVDGTLAPKLGDSVYYVVEPAQPAQLSAVAIEFALPPVAGDYLARFRLQAPSGSFIGSVLEARFHVVDLAARQAALEAERRAAQELAELEAQKAREDAKRAEEQRLLEEAAAQEKAAREEKERAEAQLKKSFKYAKELEHLESLGFTNFDLNSYLLLNNRGDLQRVVDWLLTNGSQ